MGRRLVSARIFRRWRTTRLEGMLGGADRFHRTIMGRDFRRGRKRSGRKALRSVDEQLVRAAEQMILLFTPPFDQSPQDVGYIKGYPPGVRENGGQYTHCCSLGGHGLCPAGRR